MSTQTVELGAVVQVVNQDLSGKSFVEGYAIVKGYDPKPVDGRYYCAVRFDGDSTRYYRWVSTEVL